MHPATMSSRLPCSRKVGDAKYSESHETPPLGEVMEYKPSPDVPEISISAVSATSVISDDEADVVSQ